jgi:hypothetical protein
VPVTDIGETIEIRATSGRVVVLPADVVESIAFALGVIMSALLCQPCRVELLCVASAPELREFEDDEFLRQSGEKAVRYD